MAKFIKAEIPDVVVIEPQVFGDERGYFFEPYNKSEFEEYVGPVDFVQEGQSKSSYGVLRGLHFQMDPYAQAKYVGVMRGRVLDVAVDIRKGSPTYGRHVALEISDENKLRIFIPRGFAHGFLTLSEEAIFYYKYDNYYQPEAESGIRFDDPDLSIDWRIPKEDIILSDKDKRWKFFSQTANNFFFFPQ